MSKSNASGLQLEAVSRSYQYRKVMKPLLERKRRARINKCLDELKQLIMDVVQMDEETLSKLEKADILEITVHHLHGQLKPANNSNPASGQLIHRHNFEHFWCGFQQCIVDISRVLHRHDMQLNAKVMHAMQQLMPARSTRFWRPW